MSDDHSDDPSDNASPDEARPLSVKERAKARRQEFYEKMKVRQKERVLAEKNSPAGQARRDLQRLVRREAYQKQKQRLKAVKADAKVKAREEDNADEASAPHDDQLKALLTTADRLDAPSPVAKPKRLLRLVRSDAADQAEES